MRAYGTKSGEKPPPPTTNPVRKGSDMKLAAQNLLSSSDFHVRCTFRSLITKNIAHTCEGTSGCQAAFLWTEARVYEQRTVDYGATHSYTHQLKATTQHSVSKAVSFHYFQRSPYCNSEQLTDWLTSTTTTTKPVRSDRENGSMKRENAVAVLFVYILSCWLLIHTQHALREVRNFRALTSRNPFHIKR